MEFTGLGADETDPELPGEHAGEELESGIVVDGDQRGVQRLTPHSCLVEGHVIVSHEEEADGAGGNPVVDPHTLSTGRLGRENGASCPTQRFDNIAITFQLNERLHTHVSFKGFICLLLSLVLNVSFSLIH